MTDKSEPENNMVGPVLISGAMSDAIVRALKQKNPEIAIIQKGSYLRAQIPWKCVLSADLVSQELASPFELPADLEKVMCAFQGKLTISSTEAVWEWKR